MDKHDFLTVAVGVFIHHAAELAQLHVEHLAVCQSGSRVEQFVDVKVHFDNIAFLVLFGLMLYHGTASLVGGFLLAHGALQLSAVNHHLALWHIVFHDVVGNHGIVEVHVVVEAVCLIEFCSVKTELHGGWVLQAERLVALECHILHSHALAFRQILMAQLLEMHLYVRLHDAREAACPFAAVATRGIYHI